MKTIEQKVLQFIDLNKLIETGDKVLISFSGGPDSVFALNFINKFKKKYSIEICVVHFNHQLRGKEADEEESFARHFCERLGIQFYSRKLDVKIFAKKNKLSIEEAARKLRYQELENISKQQDCSKIITAHNLNDNAETVLMNLFSGSGLSGLSGIPIKRDKIIRPFLCLSKTEILEYLQKEKIPFMIDSSNKSNDFKRNYIRNKILPLIRSEINPSVDEAVFRTSRNVAQSLAVNRKIEQRTAEKFVSFKGNLLIIKLALKDLYCGKIPGGLLKDLLKKYFGHEFSFDDYIKINSLLLKQKGKKVQLSAGLYAVRESDSVRIEADNIPKVNAVEVGVGTKIKIDSRTFGIESVSKEKIKFDKGKNIEFIDGSGLKEKFLLRRWQAGDKFKPLGLDGFKKVSDFLTDLKVPTSERKLQLVLLNRNRIVWIVGLRLDDRFKINSKTKKTYKLWVK